MPSPTPVQCQSEQESEIRARPVAFSYLVRFLRESYPRRNIKYVADGLAFDDGFYRKWENPKFDQALLYDHLTRLQDLYGMPPGVSLAICDLVELAIAKDDNKLVQYAKILQGLALRILEPRPNDATVPALAGGCSEEAYQALVSAIVGGSQAVPPSERLAFRNLRRRTARRRPRDTA